MEKLAKKLKKVELELIQKVLGPSPLSEQFQKEVMDKVTKDTVPQEIYEQFDPTIFEKFMEHEVNTAKKEIEGKDDEELKNSVNLDDPEILKAFGATGITLLLQEIVEKMEEEAPSEEDVSRLAEMIALRNELEHTEFEYLLKGYQLFLENQASLIQS